MACSSPCPPPPPPPSSPSSSSSYSDQEMGILRNTLTTGIAPFLREETEEKYGTTIEEYVRTHPEEESSGRSSTSSTTTAAATTTTAPSLNKPLGGKALSYKDLLQKAREAKERKKGGGSGGGSSSSSGGEAESQEEEL